MALTLNERINERMHGAPLADCGGIPALALRSAELGARRNVRNRPIAQHRGHPDPAAVPVASEIGLLAGDGYLSATNFRPWKILVGFAWKI